MGQQGNRRDVSGGGRMSENEVPEHTHDVSCVRGDPQIWINHHSECVVHDEERGCCDKEGVPLEMYFRSTGRNVSGGGRMSHQVPLVYYKDDGTRVEIGHCEVNIDGTGADIWGTIEDPKIRELILDEMTVGLSVNLHTELPNRNQGFADPARQADVVFESSPEVLGPKSIRHFIDEEGNIIPRPGLFSRGGEDAPSTDVPGDSPESSGGPDALPGM